MRKDLCPHHFFVGLVSAMAVSLSVIHAQEPIPSEWESFVSSSKNMLIPDTFRLQTFRNLGSDNWSFTLFNGAVVVSDKHTLKLPVGSKACFEPYSIGGYENVSAWIRCGGLDLNPTESLGFEWFRNEKQETKNNVYVATESKNWFGYFPWHIDNNPVWVNLVTYNAVKDTKGYFMTDSVYAIGHIPSYSLFKGEGGWRDTTLWSNLPPERYRSALIKGKITINEPISCRNTSVSEGTMHVASGAIFKTQDLHLYDSPLSSEGEISVSGQVVLHHTFDKKGEWYFISFPFDVYADQIDSRFQQKDGEPNDGGNYYYVLTYNGDKRSESNDASNNWEVLPIRSGDTPVFEKNKGYLIALDAAADTQTLSFASKAGSVPSDFARNGTIRVLTSSGQTKGENHGWYLCGNPLPCALPLSYLENTSSLDGYIYIYVGGEYKPYSLMSNFALPPYSAFFVKTSADAELRISHSPSTKSYPLINTSSLGSLKEPVAKELVTNIQNAGSSEMRSFIQDGRLYLENVSDKTFLTVYDLSGHVVFRQSVASGSSSLDLSLPKGIYVLSIQSSVYQEQKKITVR